MSFELKILGANSASFAHNRHQTSQYLSINNHHFLIDCGEGTQIQLMQYQIKLSRIDHIFISHLHGDHYFGLMGLISTMHLRGRKKELHVYGPPKLSQFITLQLEMSQTYLVFPLHFHPTNGDKSELLLETPTLWVESIPLNHQIACTGFLFREKPKLRRMNKEVLPQNILMKHILELKKGLDVYDDEGKLLYKNEYYTLAPRKSRSYAFCSDTKYEEKIIPLIEKVDLLYHEATFLEEQKERAAVTYHSTAWQAATIAKKARVKALLIGHYSIRYKDLQPLLDEACSLFPASRLAIEGESYILNES